MATLLALHHLAKLRDRSGIADEVIAERGYRTIDGADGYTALKRLGFSKTQANNRPGLLLPLWTPDGQQALAIYRPDTPRLVKESRPIKYELPQGASMRVDCPPRCRPMLGNPSIPLWITEGKKKADALASRGACAIGLLGVWGWKGKNAFGGTTVLPDFDLIAFDARDVRLIFDSDVLQKPTVRQSLERLTANMQRRKAQVSTVYLPAVNGTKVGVDDFLVAGHTLADLEALIEAPRPQPQPAPDTVELLLEPPRTLTRLLAWIDGHAYAITWLSLNITTNEVVNRKGEIERIAHPQPRHERRLFVMRDDGILFGGAIDPQVKPLHELGIDIAPMDTPPDGLLWTAAGVTAYLHHTRPHPAAVFDRLVTVYDHFLDFSRSLGTQRQMCRLSACISLMTWFADAFTVLPYPWANSPAPGQGKPNGGIAGLGHHTLAISRRRADHLPPCATSPTWVRHFCSMMRRC